MSIIELLDRNNEVIHPQTNAGVTFMENGKTVQEHIGELESDMFSPAITQTSSMAKFGGEYADNVEDGFYKSGILYGNSLVNLVEKSKRSLQTFVVDGEHLVSTGNGGILFKHHMLKPSTTYTLFLSIIETTGEGAVFMDNTRGYYISEGKTIPNEVGSHKVLFTTKTQEYFDELVSLNRTNGLKIGFVSVGDVTIDSNIIVLEGDHTDKDLPYFEGISSCKIPILTNVGKNLFSVHDNINEFEDVDSHRTAFVKDLEDGGFTGSAWAVGIVSEEKLKKFLKEGKTYTISYDLELIERTAVPDFFSSLAGVTFYNYTTDEKIYTASDLLVNLGDKAHRSSTFVCPNLDGYQILLYSNRYTTGGGSPYGYDTIKITNLQFTESASELPYEPYKSSVLFPTGGENMLRNAEKISGYLTDANLIAPPNHNHITYDYLSVEPNTTYSYKTFGFSSTQTNGDYWNGWYYYKQDKELSDVLGSRQVLVGPDETFRNPVFTTPSDCYFIRIGSRGLALEDAYATLHCISEDPVVLKGIGDVRDELDLTKTENNLTQRVGEIIFDGINYQNWLSHLETDTHILFTQYTYTIYDDWVSGQSISNILPHDVLGAYRCTNEGFGIDSNGKVYVCLLKSKLSTPTAAGLNDYFKSNNMIIHTKLKTQVTKTANLSSPPYGFKDGHVLLGSDIEGGLVPELEYSVATNRTGQITQNSAQLILHDKKINDLEARAYLQLLNDNYSLAMTEMQTRVATPNNVDIFSIFCKVLHSRVSNVALLIEYANVFYMVGDLTDDQYNAVMSELADANGNSAVLV